MLETIATHILVKGIISAMVQDLLDSPREENPTGAGDSAKS